MAFASHIDKRVIDVEAVIKKSMEIEKVSKLQCDNIIILFSVNER